MIQASSGENWKNTSTSKAVISRGRCRRPKNVACQLSMAPSLKAARYTPANRDQQVIESESRIDIDLCNYRQKLPYVIARKTRGPPSSAICTSTQTTTRSVGTNISRCLDTVELGPSRISRYDPL